MYYLFDLDGTLTDPGIGITNSVAFALEKFGIRVKNREELYPYIGPPLTVSFQKIHHLSPEEAQKALAEYRVYFSEKGLFENEVFLGIPEMLEKLKGEGHRLMVATSKPEEFTNRILRHFGLDRYFDFVGGNTLDEKRPTKEAVIGYIREQFPDISAENALMIGDRKYDITGAHACGLRAVGVLFGYGSREELLEAGTDALAESPQELEAVLLKYADI